MLSEISPNHGVMIDETGISVFNPNTKITAIYSEDTPPKNQ